MKPTAIILAAGASSRMGFPKALAQIGGQSLLEQQVEGYQSLARSVVVVLGCHREAITQACNLEGVVVAVNHDWRAGMASSLREGLRAAEGDGGILMTPVDCPPPSMETLQAILKQRGQGVEAIVPTYNSKGGHPVWLSASTRATLLNPPHPPRLDLALAALGEAAIRQPVTDPNVLLNINNFRQLSEYLGTTDPLGQSG